MDWIGVVEAAYELAAPDPAWLESVARTCAPALDQGQGLLAYRYVLDDRKVAIDHTITLGAEVDYAPLIARTVPAAPPAVVETLFRRGIRVGSVTQMLAAVDLQLGLDHTRMLFGQSQGSFDDVWGLVVPDGNTGVVMASFSSAGGNRRRWRAIASHLESAARLRRVLAEDGRSTPSGLCGPRVEAVLEADGRVADANGPAVNARARLTRAVLERDRARGPLRRRSPDDALLIWKGLVEGRWSLVDYFDTDGRRFVVVHRNPPTVGRNPRSLTLREQTVAERIGEGATLKEIAYDLGLGVSAVAKASARARRKLSVSSLAELALLFSKDGPRTRLERHSVGGEELAVASIDGTELDMSMLSKSERDVALRLLRGDSNRAIATARGTRVRTVANQVRCILRKSGTASRAEFAAKLTRHG